jgi:tRNA modification GTPase
LHLRQKTILDEIAACVAGGREALGRGASYEVVAEEIRRALPAAERLLGRIRTEEVIENVFARFCVGK